LRKKAAIKTAKRKANSAKTLRFARRKK
jgi:hypothetical protein